MDSANRYRATKHLHSGYRDRPTTRRISIPPLAQEWMETVKFEFGAEFWNERYRAHGAVWSGDPNLYLVSEASDLIPGTALDVGCGEGADAIWLAERGWRVTAADISSVALDRARAVGVSADVAQSIDWLQTDFVAWMPPAASYDLVSVQYMQLPKTAREWLFRRLAACVKQGGSLLIVGHHPSDLATTARRSPLPELFYTSAEVAALLEPQNWDIIVDASRERSVNDPAGRTIMVHDAVLRALRK